MNWKKLKRWGIVVVLIYIAGGVAIYFLQDAILFHPVSLKRTHQYDFAVPHKDISITINKNDTLNLVQFFSTDTVTRGVVLYFHGNKKNISWYAKYPPWFTRHGYEVIMIDYPGFGKSTGKFNEQTLYDWSALVYQFARSRYGADSIIIYGKSMGTGIAAHLAFIKPCKRLILETPYYDFPSVIKQYLPIYPVERMLHYKLPTNEYLPWVKAPITIFQGTDDRVIRYSNAKRLKELLKPADEFITIKGGSHNDLYEFKETIQKLDSLLRL
ncbi:MAG TPA: alpha/beta fold hydrolase [Chitinophagaceae bacterium]